MSVDLDRVYAKLAEQSDSARIPTLQGVLDRAHQRRRRTIATAVSAVIVVAMLVGARVFLAPGPATLPPVDVPGPLKFVTIDADVKPVFSFAKPVQFGFTTSDDKRSYAMWRSEDGEQFVGVIDLATGKALWEPVSLGKFGDSNGMQVSPKAILLLTEQGSDNPLVQNGSDTIVAVDPETGRIMWTLPYSFNDTSLVLYDDTLVISWELQGRAEALDVLTGRPKWSVNEKPGKNGLHAMRTYQEFQAFRGWNGTPVPTDRRVVLHLADGRIQIREVDTGKVLSERNGVPVKSDPATGYAKEIVLGDSLYQVDQEGLLRAELTGSGAPRRLYAKPGFNIDTSVEPCGPTLVCFVDTKEGGSAEVIAIDGNGKEQWRRPAPPRAHLTGSETGIAAVVSVDSTAAYDLSGNPLLPAGLPDGFPMWIDSGNMLIVGQDSFSGFSLTTRQTTFLGKVNTIGFCSWNATMLTCPTEKGISVWRYAN